MAKEFDIQVLNTTIISVVRDVFKKMLHVDPQSEPLVVEREIIEYDSCMRVFPLEKFNGPVYISFVNYYRTSQDQAANAPVGAFVLFVKEDIADRLLKAFGLSLREAEDESFLVDKVGEFCNILAGNVAKELSGLGYAELILSAPSQNKNSVPDGVPFDYDLYSKQEISFSFWNQKCIVVEACMGPVPQK